MPTKYSEGIKMKKYVFWSVLSAFFIILLPVKSFSQNVQYEIYVQTGNVDNAGTDQKIFITMFNELGESLNRFQFLTSSFHSDKFEKGNLDRFTHDDKDIGPITRIIIEMSIVRESALPGMGVQVSPHPEWFLDTVKILYPAPGGIDGRFLTDPTKPSSNMTNFSYKDGSNPDDRSISKQSINTGLLLLPLKPGG
jgi:hypothetical protein